MQARGDASAGLRSGLDQWARGALRSLTGMPGVVRAGIAVAEGNGRRLRFTSSDRDAGGLVDWCHVDAYDDVPITTAVRTGRPVVGDVAALASRYPEFAAAQRSDAVVAAVPITAGGRTLGGFVLFLDTGQSLDEERLARLGSVAGRLGDGLESRRASSPAREPWPDEQVPAGVLTARDEVPEDAAEVARVRRFLRRTLEDWGIDEDTVFTATLCLTELVTNAVIHCSGGCLVRVVLDDGRLTLSVRDRGSRFGEGSAVPPDALRVTGRGLELVEGLSESWGSRTEADGTTVWCVLSA